MSVYLPMVAKNIAITLEDILAEIDRIPAEIEWFDRISDLYRQLGVGDYLMTDDANHLFSNLQCAIQCYEWYLANSNSEQHAISHINVFFDALIVDDQEAVQRLAMAAPTSINKRKEYEEDHLYMRILMDVFGLGKSKADIDGMLDEYRSYHNDNEDPRFVVLEALITCDEDTFNDAVPTLIEHLKQPHNAGGDLYSGSQESSAVYSKVSCELLGLLKLASKQGIKTDPEIQLAPASVRVRCTLPDLAKDSWRTIETRRSIDYNPVR